MSFILLGVLSPLSLQNKGCVKLLPCFFQSIGWICAVFGCITAVMALKRNRVEGGDEKAKNVAEASLILIILSAAMFLFVLSPFNPFTSKVGVNYSVISAPDEFFPWRNN